MNRVARRWSIITILILAGLLINACGAVDLIPTTSQPVREIESIPFATPSLTPFQPSLPTSVSEIPVQVVPTVELTAVVTEGASNQADPGLAAPSTGIFLPSYIPDALAGAIHLPEGYEVVDEPNQAAYHLQAGDREPVSLWVYALVAPFPSIPNGISAEELRQAWNGKGSATFPDSPLLMDAPTYAVLEAVWGPGAPGAVVLQSTGDLASYAWEHRPAWGIVPFEALEPRWKVLEVDGISPIRKDFDPLAYPLAISFSFERADELPPGPVEEALQLGLSIPSSNREAGKMTTLAMTGVTALVRCTAYYMEQRGITYPGQDVRELLRGADITHISNEIPFAQACPFPDCFQEGLVFCSDPKYMELLTDIGTDIVELTGDHFADWGPDAMYYTLDLYKEQGLPYYGGGINWDEGSQAVILEHNGNRLAFIGCNGKGRGYATASQDNPGAVWCDFETMHSEIAQLRSDGYIPVATFQHFEYYTYLPQPNLQVDFRGMAEAGALIVSGSQAHQPHGMEIMGDSFLHYGLGNLFFDQFGFCPDRACDDAFIDRHVIYDGRYISTDLIPIKFVDWARPRPMTEAEREIFLQDIFSASGW
jgi:hypothetical protein